MIQSPARKEKNMKCTKGHSIDQATARGLCPKCESPIHPATKNDLEFAPSEEFKRAVGTEGSIVIDCELCGRTHFATHATEGYFDDGELAGLLKKQESDPIRFMSWDFSSVSYGHINGKQAVVDCPCNILANYERFIWQHRDLIAAFITAKAKNRSIEAEKDLRTSAAIVAAVLVAGAVEKAGDK